jgi:hypothetical protein
MNLNGDPDAEPHVAVWRSVHSLGDVKTKKSRRTLRLPLAAVEALRVHKVKQAGDRLLTGALWHDHGLVFASAVGTPLDPSHVRRAFRNVCVAAGIGTNWSPREPRHTFVSIMSEQGVSVEEIARRVAADVNQHRAGSRYAACEVPLSTVRTRLMMAASPRPGRWRRDTRAWRPRLAVHGGASSG